VTIDARDEVLARAVPHMLLQPLVENAFRHGIARRSGPSFVGVRGSRRGDALVLEVEDDGEGLPEVIAEGVGLRNTRARLRAYYGDTATLELCGRTGGGTLATICVPWAAA
jgi:LytS/YehU family sensor histidine kinase